MTAPTPIGTFRIGSQPIKMFGWVPPELRTPDQERKHMQLVGAMPAFSIAGAYRVDNRKVALYEARKTIAAAAQPPYIKQLTGSCVGCGGMNAVLTLRDVEIALKGENERPEMLWWPYTYGESRQIAGMSGQGEGSFGSAWAEAAKTKGMFSSSVDGLPQYRMDDGWYVLTREIELKWSDGQQAPAKYDALAKEHLVQTAAPCRSPEDVAAALQNGYPCSIASMFGTRGPKVMGEPQVAVAEWDDQWAHQQFIDAWWDHPQLGELFRIGNNWGNVHGPQPDGSPLGGYWIRKSVLQRLCSDRGTEIYAFSGLNGFPARQLPSSWMF